jgi:hypothetical protein
VGALAGGREARNDLAIGYAWLAAAALIVGVPKASESSNFGQLVAAIGPVGVGVAVSFVAFLLGSVLTEYLSKALAIRGARFVEPDQPGDDPGVIYPEDYRDEAVRLLGSLDRAEAMVDKLNGEVILRFFLIPPLLVVCGVAAVENEWIWVVVAAVAVAVLVVQGRGRLFELRENLAASARIRDALRELGG